MPNQKFDPHLFSVANTYGDIKKASKKTSNETETLEW